MIETPPHSPVVWLFVTPIIVVGVYLAHALLLLLADLIVQAVSLILRLIQRWR